jgi:hypothetical protein
MLVGDLYGTAHVEQTTWAGRYSEFCLLPPVLPNKAKFDLRDNGGLSRSHAIAVSQIAIKVPNPGFLDSESPCGGRTRMDCFVAERAASDR